MSTPTLTLDDLFAQTDETSPWFWARLTTKTHEHLLVRRAGELLHVVDPDPVTKVCRFYVMTLAQAQHAIVLGEQAQPGVALWAQEQAQESA